LYGEIRNAMPDNAAAIVGVNELVVEYIKNMYRKVTTQIVTRETSVSDLLRIPYFPVKVDVILPKFGVT
jgi:hypothetical protein